MIPKDIRKPADFLFYTVIPQTNLIGKAVAFFQRYSRFGYKGCHWSTLSINTDFVIEETPPKARLHKLDWDYLDRHYLIKLFRVKGRDEKILIQGDLSYMGIDENLRFRMVNRFEKYLGFSPITYRKKKRWEHILDFQEMLLRSGWKYDLTTILTLGLVNGAGIHCAENVHLELLYSKAIDKKDLIPKPNEVVEYSCLEQIA